MIEPRAFGDPIPILMTDRLTLGGPRVDDFVELAAIWADPEVVRHIGGRPFTGEETWARLLRCAGHWSLMGYGPWAIRERATGRFVGQVGFADLRRDLTPSIAGLPELGWALAPWAHGRGFATEAALAALEWGESRFEATRATCLIHPDNAPSLRVAEKCGFVEFARTPYKDQPAILLDRPIGGRPVG